MQKNKKERKKKRKSRLRERREYPPFAPLFPAAPGPHNTLWRTDGKPLAYRITSLVGFVIG